MAKGFKNGFQPVDGYASSCVFHLVQQAYHSAALIHRFRCPLYSQQSQRIQSTLLLMTPANAKGHASGADEAHPFAAQLPCWHGSAENPRLKFISCHYTQDCYNSFFILGGWPRKEVSDAA